MTCAWSAGAEPWSCLPAVVDGRITTALASENGPGSAWQVACARTRKYFTSGCEVVLVSLKWNCVSVVELCVAPVNWRLFDVWTSYDVAPPTGCHEIVYCTPEDAEAGTIMSGAVSAGHPVGGLTTVKCETVDLVDGQPLESASMYQLMLPAGTVASSRCASGDVPRTE